MSYTLRKRLRTWKAPYGWGGQNIANTMPTGSIVPLTDATGIAFTQPSNNPINVSQTEDVLFKMHLNLHQRFRYTFADWQTFLSAGTDVEMLITPVIRFNGGAWQEFNPKYISFLPDNFATVSSLGSQVISSAKDLYLSYEYLDMPAGNYTIDVALRYEYVGPQMTTNTPAALLKTLTVWESQLYAEQLKAN